MNTNEIKKVNAKDFDWKLFHDDRVVIMVDNRDMDNLDKTMELLNKAGYRWSTGASLTAKDAQGYKAITDGSHGYVAYLSGTYGCYHDHGVYWSDEYSRCERPVKITFDEHTDNDKIVITNDGKITTATLYSNGKKAGIGTAICHDSDKFDIYTGATLALLRLEKYKKKVEMTDWERFVKGEVNMRVPKKHIQNFLSRAEKDSLRFTGPMEAWYLKWLKEDGDSVLIGILSGNVGGRVLTQVLRHDNGTEVLYIPGMK